MAEPLKEWVIDGLSAEAERFGSELNEEQYLHFSGQKETYDIAPIYERHEEDAIHAAATLSTVV